jgi:RNA polymerase sigma-70 factor (ECF subfamily)
MAKSDEDLIRAARNGDEDAFVELVRRYEPQVASTIHGILGSCPEVDDVGQETYMRFYESLERFREEASPGTYLVRIAINLSLNELKRRKRSLSLFSNSRLDELQSVPREESSEASFEDKEIIREALSQLTPEYRAVLVLRLMDGYSTAETARILKVPVGTVLSRMARGQEKLEELLRPYFGE